VSQPEKYRTFNVNPCTVEDLNLTFTR